MSPGFNLQDYQPVEDRIEAFWRDHPKGRLETELVRAASASGERWIVKAFAYRDGDDKPAGTGYAFEVDGQGNVNRTSALENCETSALGRCLANLGYAAKGKRPSREEMAKANRQQPGPVERPPSSGSAVAPGPVPPTVHESNVETQVMDLSAAQWVRKLVDTYTEDRVAKAAKEVAPKLNHRLKDFKSIEKWPVADVMEIARVLQLPEWPDVAGSAPDGTDAGGPASAAPGTPPLDLLQRAKKTDLIRWSDIAKHSRIFTESDSKVPANFAQLEACSEEVLEKLVAALNLRERIEPAQAQLETT